MERLLLQFKLKDVSEDGTFTGYASVKGNVDLGLDRVINGAFTKTIQENPEVPLLWQHDPSQPIGIVRLKEDQKGLFVEGKYVLEVQRAREAHALAKAKALKGLSFGYEVIKKVYENGIRVLQELRVHEVSNVTFPMNPEAGIMSVKGNKFSMMFAEANERSQLISAKHTMFDTLSSVIGECLYGPYDGTTATDEQIAEHLGKSMDDFKSAILDWFPKMRSVLMKKDIELDMEFKEGRVLSAANRKKVQEAFDALQALLDVSEPGKSHSFEIEEAAENETLDGVLSELRKKVSG